MIQYGFTKDLDIPCEKMIELVTEALKKEGFGILTEINVRDKFHEKLGSDFKKYMILGACNPPNAYKAILSEENIGLMLPCNVIVYEKQGRTRVAAFDPMVMSAILGNRQMEPVVDEVKARLERVIAAM